VWQACRGGNDNLVIETHNNNKKASMCVHACKGKGGRSKYQDTIIKAEGHKGCLPPSIKKKKTTNNNIHIWVSPQP
jgi:hypothetical protein